MTQPDLLAPERAVKTIRTQSSMEFFALTGRAARAEIEIYTVEKVTGQPGAWNVTFKEIKPVSVSGQ